MFRLARRNALSKVVTSSMTSSYILICSKKVNKVIGSYEIVNA